jgi:tRNA U34 2-thiouridine synthase MnmA/TrmU
MYVLQKQGVEVIPLILETPFFEGKRPLEIAQKNGFDPIVMDILEKFLPILRSPKYGYGDQMNPCIDCHILMLRMAKEKMQELKAHFVVTGEVLGQRPMSQNKQALRLIERESGLEGLLLRPLSAKLLPPSIPEKQGIVDRERLLGISGRSRKMQMELVKAYGINHFATPAGGCLLTEPNYVLRLKDLLAHKNEVKRLELELLKLGRHFRLNPMAKLILGRNKRENEALEELWHKGVILLRCLNTPGPVGLLFGVVDEQLLQLACEIVAAYADPIPLPVLIEVSKDESRRGLEVKPTPKEACRVYLVSN